jgi:hypothetical protein
MAQILNPVNQPQTPTQNGVNMNDHVKMVQKLVEQQTPTQQPQNNNMQNGANQNMMSYFGI